MLDIILDAILDTAKMLPFLFIAYFIIEYIERRYSQKIEKALHGGGKWGFVPAAVLGLVPQCGFSAMAAGLYSSRAVTAGTVVAVFLATSDEAVPVLLSLPNGAKALGALLILKLVVAIIAGFLIDTVLTKVFPKDVIGGFTGSAASVECEKHEENSSIILSALKHTIRIGAFVLLVNLILGFITGFVGEVAISRLVSGFGIFQPFITGLIGLVPSCAISIALTQLYSSGVLSFGGLFAGLCTGAGAGLLVLLRTNKNVKQNAFIIGSVYIIGVIAGFLV